MAATHTTLFPGRFIAGAALGALVAVGVSHLLLGGELNAVAVQRNQRVGVVSLNALTALAQRTGEDGDKLRQAAADWQKDSGALSLRVVKFQGISLEASTDPRDVGDSAAPRRLTKEEKSLYDRGQRLRAAVETNRDEGISRKDEIELERNADGSLTLTGPWTQGPDVVGLVQVVLPRAMPAEKPSLPLSLAFSLMAVALTAAAALVFRKGERPVHRYVVSAVGVVGLLASLAAHGNYAGGVLTAQRDAATSDVAAAAKAQAAVIVRVTASQGLEALALTPGAWDTDVAHHSLGALTPEGEIAVHATAPALLGRALVLLSLLASALFLLMGLGAFHKLWRTLVEHRTAYAYIAPAMIGMGLLVFFPFGYGITLSFTDSTLYNSNKTIAETWIGLQNYSDIIFNFDVISKSVEGGWAINYANFYWTLLFTIIWTITNVTIGVTVGLALALVLNIKNLWFRPVYRVLLILPWAVPNYITALIWKGMFHRQFGVINHLIVLMGGQALSWFDAPISSFATALTTNAWLSFPFMMVVSLGALQSIPDELYEAAEVDGASKWQQFFAITLPALRPALVPAIILSVVWTFNMFNIIYLVTGGEPGGATEILVTQAFKHAFERYRYGYAAAYSTVIFLILLVYGVFQNRVSRATEA